MSTPPDRTPLARFRNTRLSVRSPALYWFCRRAQISPSSRAEAAALLPSRQEFANLWRYLRARQSGGYIEDTAQRLARNVARSFGIRETFMRTQVCLAVFHDRGLIRMERTADHLRIQVRDTGEKVDLESTALMRQLRHMAGDD